MNKDSVIELVNRIYQDLVLFEKKESTVQITYVDGLYYANVFTKYDENALIKREVQTGVDEREEVAILKSLVERVERLTVRMYPDDHPTTDGTAAFPIIQNRDDSLKMARNRAMFEAVERYAWLEWWDFRCPFEIVESSKYHLLNSSKLFKKPIDELNIVTEIVPIYLKIHGLNLTSLILITKLRGGGYTCAGAADEDLERANFRALSELFRHLSAVNKIRQSGLNTNQIDDYHTRLSAFASGDLDNIVEKRINFNLEGELFLPSVVIDKELKQNISDSVVVYRYLFDGQRPFTLGGEVKLCF